MNSQPNIMTETPDTDTLGGRLSRARDSKGLGVAAVAGHIGVTLKTIQAWEADRSEPRANRLVMLAGFLGVTPTWLIHGVGQAPDEENLPRPELRAEVEALKERQNKMIRRIERLETLLQAVKAA
ncbi:helix-turn-helix domain-containing protein [Phyllobacterium sp. 21LDTY02-6]|uniref:helix-turn-helix domain-containing protein n=1 Tax=unclassified Phyllobacterium TaxID=2638441 RepID=UPI00201FC330|nr:MULTISPECIES: helix-turn-helix domain-containing protein [unclassified Phyllobacterium]MCO4316407.1 helix-turn-helix domain-containing protein [Phyllobacterium sp. 21LDTY02-6]MCX8280790.1 helix-turn-helix domain-containing protein [Phyllobacterium sp. 0TCS1.6C]MCX8292633.1 helix-turn-helix domain-containing protein [Phyllobacterium sp. 0TCS1.6A]